MKHITLKSSAVAVMAMLFLGCENTPTEVETTPKDEPTVTLDGMKFIPATDSVAYMHPLNTMNSGVYSPTLTYSFHMDSTEVTQKAYDNLMSNSYDHYATPAWSEQGGLGDNYAAYHVNWFAAVLYCNAKSNAEGKDTVYTYDSITGAYGTLENIATDYSVKGYRLPTEAEWEYACRAGTTTDHYWGDDESASIYAWWGGSNVNAVAQKFPNALGLYDMSGNVWEWCGDWDGDYSSLTPTGPETGSQRVKRGGSWYDDKYRLSSGYRHSHFPELGSTSTGFRTVCVD